LVKVEDINARQQIAFFCAGCGWRVSVESDGSTAMAVPPTDRKLSEYN
jgi:hypothetical protein